VELALVAVLAGGHALLVGVPGLAKTLLVNTLGTVLGLDAGRIQFTPDLMPADITGSEVMEEDEHGRRHFRFIPGPVFCQLLMPDREAEARMLIATTGQEEATASRVLDAAELMRIQHLVRLMPVGEKLAGTILDVVRAARPGQPEADDFINGAVAWGPGPRAGQALMLGARARALLHGRFAPSVDDVEALLDPVLRHRMALTFSARADGVRLADVIARLKERIA